MGLTPKQFAENLIRKWKGTLYIPTVEHQIYSTEETVIGSYMGKPLYRKVFRVSYKPGGKTESSILVQAGVPNIELLIKTGVSTNWGGRYLRDYGIHNNTGIVDPYVDKNTGDIGVIASGTLGNNLEITEIIVEYTKTTDTTTTSKVPYEPLTEYSTEERMVGFWIDGKPIYRKTVNCGALPNATDKEMSHGINNLDKVIDISGLAYRSSDGVRIKLPRTSVSLDNVVDVFVRNDKLVIRTGSSNPSTFNESYVTLYYTKTTD